MARYILDNPDMVRGKRVLDFAAGCGIAAIAAMQAGAKSAKAAEIDPMALVAIELNAALNSVTVENIVDIDMSKPTKGYDVILAGDVCYQQAMSTRMMGWLWLCFAQGARVVGGPRTSLSAARSIGETRSI